MAKRGFKSDAQRRAVFAALAVGGLALVGANRALGKAVYRKGLKSRLSAGMRKTGSKKARQSNPFALTRGKSGSLAKARARVAARGVHLPKNARLSNNIFVSSAGRGRSYRNSRLRELREFLYGY